MDPVQQVLFGYFWPNLAKFRPWFGYLDFFGPGNPEFWRCKRPLHNLSSQFMSPMDKHTFVAKIHFLVVKVFQTQLKWRALSLGIWLVIQTQKAILWTEFQTRWKFNLRWQSQIVSNLSVEVSNSERSLETLATGTFLSFGLSFDDWKIELWFMIYS